MGKKIQSALLKIRVLLVLMIFLTNQVFWPINSLAQSIFNLPASNTMIFLSPGFVPAVLKGVKVNPNDPLNLDFIMDIGSTEFSDKELNDESTKLIKYFLASLTIPNDELWVNLSPYEKDKIIPNEFGQTEMGRDLLAQDYILKQITASLMYPENELGKEFWNKIYAKAQEMYGTTDVPVNTFNKVWIVPDKAVVYENGDTAYIASSHLKVMLEEDYVALNKGISGNMGTIEMGEEKSKAVNDLSASIVREIILPELEKEVNQGKNFVSLRQIYNSLILATWFKRSLKESLLGKVFLEKRKIDGVNVDDKDIKQKIYNQYVDAFKNGLYNYMKEDYDPVTQEVVERKYFSGGMPMGKGVTEVLAVTRDSAVLGNETNDFRNLREIDTNFRLRSESGQEATLENRSLDGQRNGTDNSMLAEEIKLNELATEPRFEELRNDTRKINFSGGLIINAGQKAYVINVSSSEDTLNPVRIQQVEYVEGVRKATDFERSFLLGEKLFVGIEFSIEENREKVQYETDESKLLGPKSFSVKITRENGVYSAEISDTSPQDLSEGSFIEWESPLTDDQKIDPIEIVQYNFDLINYERLSKTDLYLQESINGNAGDAVAINIVVNQFGRIVYIGNYAENNPSIRSKLRNRELFALAFSVKRVNGSFSEKKYEPEIEILQEVNPPRNVFERLVETIDKVNQVLDPESKPFDYAKLLTPRTTSNRLSIASGLSSAGQKITYALKEKFLNGQTKSINQEIFLANLAALIGNNKDLNNALSEANKTPGYSTIFAKISKEGKVETFMTFINGDPEIEFRDQGVFYVELRINREANYIEIGSDVIQSLPSGLDDFIAAVQSANQEMKERNFNLYGITNLNPIDNKGTDLNKVHLELSRSIDHKFDGRLWMTIDPDKLLPDSFITINVVGGRIYFTQFKYPKDGDKFLEEILIYPEALNLGAWYSVGRSKEGNAIIVSQDKKISGTHFKFRIDPTDKVGVYNMSVEDLGSSNGTVIGFNSVLDAAVMSDGQLQSENDFTKGGIDFNTDKLDLERKGNGMKFNIPDEFKNIDPDTIKGITPVILQIVPVTNLPIFLGINEKKQKEEENSYL